MPLGIETLTVLLALPGLEDPGFEVVVENTEEPVYSW
jgi:hypothetical protein